MEFLPELVGESPDLVAVRERIARLVARASDVRRLPPVLIQGETGTGKGLVARALHRAGPRSQGPFVDVNCAAIPETLLEAEMFGYERGAFTDARQAKRGLFQTAHRGTLFLDEIGLLPEGLQAKLLTVLEERTVRRLGATQSEAVDVWIIAATNADLQAGTRSGRFREDLYHRLAVLTLVLPPLRERGDDILLLAEHLLGRACADYGLPRRTLAPDARAALLAHSWPGNVRELANAMERVALLSEAAVVTAEMLALPGSPVIRGAASPASSTTPSSARGEDRAPATLAATVDSAERAHVLEALEATGWNVSRAAARLGVSRNTLRYRIEKHALRPGGPGPPRRSRAPEGPARLETRAPEAAPVTPPPPAPEEATPASGVASVRWERRRLTLLRIVIDGDPGPGPSAEASRAIETGAEKVQAFGGRVEDLSPTGLVAAFGVDPAEDAARRAALAALAVHTALRRMSSAAEAGLVKVGIHLAPLLIGRVGKASLIDREDKAVALTALETVLRAHAPGGIVVTAAVAPFLARRFELSPLAGAAGAAAAFRLAGVEPSAAGAGRAARFVGREHDLRLLRTRLDSATRGQGQVVAIAGDAGIGKSRLVSELHESLAGEAIRYLSAGGRSFGTAIPYLVVTDILRSATGVAEGEAPETARRKIQDTLDRAGLSPAEDARYLVPLLVAPDGASPGALQSPEVVKARTFEIFRELLIRPSRVEPVVLVVEDLHWVDRTSEECLAALVDAIAGARVLLITTHRPGYRPPWLDKSYATQMALQPLGPDNSRAVVGDVLGDRPVPGAVVDLILAKADGNPFFLEELARALRHHPDAASPPAVPDTVEEVLLARIDKLPAEEKALLQCAAVVGKSVSLGLLRAIADTGDPALRRILNRLQSAEFLFETRTGPEPEYEFTHALTHEVAYGSLLSTQRRGLHARLLATIEQRPEAGIEDVERLARHAAGAEAWPAVVTHARQAGMQALRRSAHREAAAWLDEAIAALRRLPGDRALVETAIDVRFELRTALLPIGEFSRMFTALQEAETLAASLADRRRLARVWAYMTDYFRQVGDSARGREVGRRALETAEELGDTPLVVATRIYLGHVYYDLGEYRQGAEHFLRVVALIGREHEREPLGLPYVPAVHARAWLVLCLGEVGSFDEGARLADEALTLAEGLEHPLSLISACVAVGRIWQRRGDADRAIPALERGLALSRTWHVRLWIPTIDEGLGLARLMRGEVAEGREALREGMEMHEAMRGSAALSPRASALGHAAVLAGDLGEGARLAARALELARDHGERGNEAHAHWLLGEVGRHQTPPDPAAETSYRRAIEVASALDMQPLVARCLLDLSGLHGALGRTLEADAARAEALRLFRHLGMPAWIERASAPAPRLG